MPVQTATVAFYRDTANNVHAVVTTPYGQVDFVIPNGPIPSGYIPTGMTVTSVFTPKPEPGPRKVSAKQSRRASIRQEESIAKNLGGRRQPGSGALPGIKGDVKVDGTYRIEAKYTRNKTYRLDRAELNKIRGECVGLEVPLFVVDFVDPQTGGSPDRWVALPFHHFQRMKYEPLYETSHYRGST